MRYADIKKNDVVDCEQGICVSFWTQGCPHKCPGCHNENTWDRTKGKEKPKEEIVEELISSLKSFGIKRSFSILGGEPLAPYNKKDVVDIVKAIKKEIPDLFIYLWTGYTYEYLINLNDKDINYLLKTINVLIDGPFILKEKDITLKLKGSKNQRVIYLKGE